MKEEIKPFLEKTLQKGDNGEEVKKLQEFLKAQGFTRNTPDGDFGPGTKKAVEAFQKANELEVTGIVDEKTIEVITKIVAETQKQEEEAAKEAEAKGESAEAGSNITVSTNDAPEA